MTRPFGFTRHPIGATLRTLALALGVAVAAIACKGAEAPAGPPGDTSPPGALPPPPPTDAGGGNNPDARGSLSFGEPVNITPNDSRNNQNPTWAPDGRRLGFTRQNGTSSKNEYALWMMGADGASPAQVLGMRDRDHVNMPGRSWCAQNDRILLSSDRSGGTHIWSVKSDGSGLTELTTPQQGADTEPVWSPNCDRIAFQSNRSGSLRIWTMNADGGNARQLSSDARKEDWEPNWSPVGEEIVFQARGPSTKNRWTLWTVDATSGKETAITDGTTGDDTDPSFSPDGARIVYSREIANTDGANIAILDLSTPAKAPEMITRGDAYSGAPAWSPDGTRIAFESDRSGNLDIWVATQK